MADYYVADLRLSRAEDLYISFRRPERSDGVCWPLPWAGVWPEAGVRQAAESIDGVETVAVPTEAVHALATAPAAGRIDGDVGPIVRNSASNRRALVLAARRDIARTEAFDIPYADHAVQGGESMIKALGLLLPLLCREENVGNDRLWLLRADLLASLHAGDPRRGQRAVQAVNAAVGASGASQPAPLRRPARPLQPPGHAEVAILQFSPHPVMQQPPSPDAEVGAKVSKS